MDPRIWLLTAAQFASATGAYAYTGLLAPLADDLGVGLATAGQLAAAYALTFALLGPIAAALTARVERRALLAIGLGFAAAFNLLSAFVPDFTTALMLRVAAGIAATLVLPGVAATMLVPPEQRGRAIATVLSGLTFAFALGIPSAPRSGPGWGGGAPSSSPRASRPRPPSASWPSCRACPRPTGAARSRSASRCGPDILSVLGTSFLAFAGLFCIAAYIGPIVTATTGMEGAGIGAIQVFIGLGSLVGILLGGKLSERRGAAVPVRLVLLLAAALLGYAALLSLPPALWHAAPLALCVFSGAVALFAMAPISQARLVGLAPQDRSVALALAGAVTFAGQGAGAAMGGAAIGAFGLVATGVVGSAAAVLGAVLASRAYAERAPVTSA
jgi:DHA1 family inner membrane transport protein